MPDCFPVLKVNSDNQNNEYLRFFFVRVETVHFHEIEAVLKDFRVPCLMKRFL